MKKLTFSLLLLAFASLLNSCGTQKTVAVKPDLGIAKKNTLPLSTINLPISVNCLSLENNINKQFTGVLYNDESFENNNNDNLIVKISKDTNVIIYISIFAFGQLIQLLFTVLLLTRNRNDNLNFLTLC